MSEPSCRHFARGKLYLSSNEKKYPGNNKCHLSCRCSQENKRKESSSESSFTERLSFNINRTDAMTSITEKCESRHSFDKQDSKNRILKRLANCLTSKHKVLKSRTGKRNVVLGFHPRLCTIHENVTAVFADSEAVATNKFGVSHVVEREFAPFCRNSDPKLAALHEDIRELWERLENVEKEFASARGSLEMSRSDVNN